MTDQQINAAIDKFTGCDGNECCCDECHPDWCNDLNAINYAESKLTDSQLWDMANIMNTQGEPGFRATARQRAEAFLRTLGKWEEVQG